jgi:hypothetical protein
MLSQKIDTLKTLMTNATDLSEPMKYFFDVLVPDEAFMSAGKRSQSRAIVSTFILMAESLYQQAYPDRQPAKAQLGILLWLKDYELAHGSCMIGDKLTAMFYFRDLDMGIGSLGSFRGHDPMVTFARFSIQTVDSGAGKIHVFDQSGFKH